MRFLQFDGEVYDKEKQDIGVDPDKHPINLYIDPDRIVCVRDHYDDDDGYNGCIIYTDGGHDFWTPLDTEDVLRKLDYSNEGITSK